MEIAKTGCVVLREGQRRQQAAHFVGHAAAEIEDHADKAADFVGHAAAEIKDQADVDRHVFDRKSDYFLLDICPRTRGS